MSLSLTVARLLAQLMGGSLSVRDALDRDVSWVAPCLPATVFTVKLPLTLADEGAHAEAEEARYLEMQPIQPAFAPPLHAVPPHSLPPAPPPGTPAPPAVTPQVLPPPSIIPPPLPPAPPPTQPTLTMLLDSHPHLSLLRPYRPLCVPLSTSVKCLVVDDVLLNRRLTSRQLIRLGARADTAESGEEAIRLCEQSGEGGSGGCNGHICTESRALDCC